MQTIDNEERLFTENIDAAFEERVFDFTKTLNIAVVGKVSAGKSSLLNAILRRGRDNQVAAVGAESGVTTKLKVIRLDERVRIIDSPGLDDVRAENSQVTQDFLKHIDVGIFVVTGSADASQKRNVDDLRSHCDKVFVVVNKFDEWSRHSESAREKVLQQWRETLGVEKVYPTCAFGYDPETNPDAPLDIQGVDELRDDVESFLASKGKDLLLARQMGKLTSYANAIIIGALLAVAGEAFIPGSAVYITATQAAAICSLYYLYTGKVLSKQNALALLPSFAAQSIGTNVFLWVKSFLPPTGVLDVAAAGVAVTITLAMLAAVNGLLASGHELNEKEVLQRKFRDYKDIATKTLLNSSLSDWRSKEFWSRLARDFMYAP